MKTRSVIPTSVQRNKKISSEQGESHIYEGYSSPTNILYSKKRIISIVKNTFNIPISLLERCYHWISKQLEGQYTKAAFFKNMKKLVDLNVFNVNDKSKTNYYKLNKKYIVR